MSPNLSSLMRRLTLLVPFSTWLGSTKPIPLVNSSETFWSKTNTYSKRLFGSVFAYFSELGPVHWSVCNLWDQLSKGAEIWLLILALVGASMLDFAVDWLGHLNKTTVHISHIADCLAPRFLCWWCDPVASSGNSVLKGLSLSVTKQTF